MASVQISNHEVLTEDLEICLLGNCRFGSAEFADPTKKGLEMGYALWVYLLLTSPAQHRREQIATLFWPEQPTKKGLGYLRQMLRRLHKIAGEPEEGTLFSFTNKTLQANPHEKLKVDVWLFDALYQQAQQKNLPMRQRIHLLQQMTQCYQGKLFTQLSFHSEKLEEWFARQQILRHDKAMSAFHELMEYSAQFGQWSKVITLAKRCIALDELPEKAYSFWIQGLYNTEQSDEAQQVFLEYQQQLQEKYQLEVPEELKNLVQEYQYGTAIRKVAPGRTRRTHSQLPRNVTPFFGRKQELLELESLLMNGQESLVTIRGEGGMGKTRLAVAIAKKVLHYFPAGAYFVSLDRIRIPAEQDWRQPGSSIFEMSTMDNLEELSEHNQLQIQLELLQDAIASSLGLSGHPSGRTTRQLLRFLADKELLLVLDNFEHFVECRTFIQEIQKHAPLVMILVTSRQELQTENEYVFALQGLHHVEAQTQDTITDNPSVQLFYESARRSTGKALSEQKASIVHTICQQVDGMPLAIELAATLTSEVTCEDLSHQIAEKTMEFKTSKRGIPPRQQSMRAVFDYSWALLGNKSRKALIQCAIFHGGFEQEAMVEITQLDASELDLLHRKSLLRKDEHQRYSFHPLLEEFARERLMRFEQKQQVKQTSSLLLSDVLHRYAEYYLKLLAENTGAQDADSLTEHLQALNKEHDNIRYAWSWAVEKSAFPILMDSWENMFLMYYNNGLYLEGKQLFTDTINVIRASFSANPGKDSKEKQFLLLRCMCFEIHFLHSLGRYEASELKVDAFLHFIERSPDLWGRAYIELLQAKLAQFKGDKTQTVQHFENALRISKKHQFYRLQINVLKELTPESIESGKKALVLCEEHNEHLLKISCLDYLAGTYLETGEFDKAYPYLQQELELAEKAQNIPVLARCLTHMGMYEWGVAQFQLALQHLSEAAALAKDCGYYNLSGAVHSELGLIYNTFGLYERAEETFQEGLIFERKANHTRGQAHIQAYRMLPMLSKGAFEEAEDTGKKALSLAEQVNEFKVMSHIHTQLGHLYSAQKEYEKAEQHYLKGLQFHEKLDTSMKLRLEPYAGLARQYQLLQQTQKAKESLSPHLELLLTSDLSGIFEPGRVFWDAYQTCKALQLDETNNLLQRAKVFLQERLQHILPPNHQTSFKESVLWHRELLQQG